MPNDPKKTARKEPTNTLEEIDAATDRLKKSGNESRDYADKLLGLGKQPRQPKKRR